MTQWQAHESTVDTLLDRLRCAMLGYLHPCFPPHLTTRSQQRGAIRTIAERLTFCFAAAIKEPDSTTVLICRKRLYTVLTYLFFECLKPDQTYYNVLRLMALDSTLLTRMTERAKRTPASFRRHYHRIADLDINLEPAILLFLSQDRRLPPGFICSAAVARALAAFQNTS